MFRLIVIVAFAPLILATGAWPAQAGETVRVENGSRPTQCAEVDNVYVKFIGADIRRLSIAAMPPAYLAGLREDRMAADFSNCDMSHDRVYPFQPKDVTLYEDADYALIGHTFAGFWRPDSVDFRVGNTVTHDLHLVQLVRKVHGRPIEILVVYPPDGYWRIKPLPPPDRTDTGYGSSFLIGPIEEDGRPFVHVSAIAFDRATLTFRLSFKGGEGSVRVVEASPRRTRLAVTLPPSPAGTPFAALRSMFVSPAIADAAEASWKGAGGQMEVMPILDFTRADARAVTFGRSTQSNHNSSAPDLRFGDFDH